MDKISIIIPVYNVEAYLRKCLDSVIAQTYTNVEIILINDGSTDDSGVICDEYAKADSRIKVFHQPNKGASAARNIGLKNFTGQYIGFVDSDDWIEPNMYEVLYNLIKAKNTSFSVVSYFKEFDDRSVPMIDLEAISTECISQIDIIKYIFRGDIYKGFCIVGWNKLYNAEFLQKNEIFYDETQITANDVLYTMAVVLSSNCTASYVDIPLYHYRVRDSSLMRATSASVLATNTLAALKKVIDMLVNSGYEYLTVLVKKEICYYASVIAEIAIIQKDVKTLGRMKSVMKTYLCDYMEVYKDYPDWINRIRELIEKCDIST